MTWPNSQQRLTYAVKYGRRTTGKTSEAYVGARAWKTPQGSLCRQWKRSRLVESGLLPLEYCSNKQIAKALSKERNERRRDHQSQRAQHGLLKSDLLRCPAVNAEANYTANLSRKRQCNQGQKRREKDLKDCLPGPRR